jgi:hypothetical protein
MKQNSNTAQQDTTMRDKPMVDSYAQFLDHFGIEKTDFYSFGLDNTIFSEADKAMEQWLELKKRLLNNQTIAIRGYGRQGKRTQLYIDLYSSLFGNKNILEDPTNNAIPKRNLRDATGYRINKNIMNYQCSHIFGCTKNPLLFEAVWNICFIPKMFDPFTGHETKGLWPKEYQKKFHQAAYARFHELIHDYNELIISYDVTEKIEQYVKNAEDKNNRELLHKFRIAALSEWEKISLRGE